MLKSVTQINKLMTIVLNFVLIVVVLALVLSVTWGVLTRSVASGAVWISQSTGWEPWSWLPAGQANWTEELARFLLIWTTLLGGATAFGVKGHLGVDYFVEKLDPEVRKWMATFANSVVLFFALSIFVWGGLCVVSDALSLDQTTPALGWKMGHVYLALPISGFFMVLFTLQNLLETLNSEPVAEMDQKEIVGEAK